MPRSAGVAADIFALGLVLLEATGWAEMDRGSPEPSTIHGTSDSPGESFVQI